MTPASCHPVELDPDLRAADAGRRAGRARRARDRRARAAASTATTSSLAREFDRRARRPRPTRVRRRRRRGRSPTRGEMLARVVPRERPAGAPSACAPGCSTASTPPTLAGLVSTFVYEHRSPEPPPPPWFPSDDVQRRWRRIAGASARTSPPTSGSDGLGRAPPARPGVRRRRLRLGRRARSFAEVVADEELTGGDFVRTMKQLIDLARPDRPRRTRRRHPARRPGRPPTPAFRGVVADVVAGVADADPATTSGGRRT